MREKDKQQLAERYLDLYRMAFALLRNETDTEDCVQEAMAVTMAHTFLLDPYQYCTKVLHNQCYQLLRRRGYSLPKELPELSENNEDNKLYEYRLVQLARLKEQLPERVINIIDMYYRDGYTLAQIASMQGISESMVKKLLNKGKMRLQKQMIEFDKKNKN